jgi:thymidylate synthase (FAD)
MTMLDPLGDGISRVEHLDHMGDDLRVVNAARISFDRESHLECDETGQWLQEQDEKLIGFLAEHEHVSPFFHPQICLRITMPSFLAHQWWRSTVGVCRSEVYRRYVVAEPECYLPTTWRPRAANPKQGSGPSELDPGQQADLSAKVEKLHREIKALYRQALEGGVAPEMAQMILPQSTYTRWIETGSLHYFVRAHHLHTGPMAQRELTRYAEAVGRIVSELFPVSWKALSGCSAD